MRLVLAALAAAFTLSGCVAEAEPQTQVASAEGRVLAELFTSQGCSSCPPAEAYFEELTKREGVVVIVWHVDVWDTLVHRGSAWKDPYSQAAFTARLREYNKALRGTPQIFTPQAIIGGEISVIASREGEVSDAIANAGRSTVEVSITGGVASVSGSGKGEVIYVRLLRQHETDVEGGENRGLKLSGKNIALQGKVLGKWKGKDAAYDTPALEENETCAVFVQAPYSGKILGAGMCD